MKRRNFLKLSALGTAAVSLPALGYYTVTSNEQAAAGLILDELSYLKIERAEVERFVKDYFSMRPQDSAFNAKIRFCYKSKISAARFYSTSSFVKNFLLSTDFFRNGMDEESEIKYLALYDPYRYPCSNPFSSIYNRSGV